MLFQSQYELTVIRLLFRSHLQTYGLYWHIIQLHRHRFSLDLNTHLIKEKITTIGFLGTSFSMEMDFYKDRLKNFGLNVLIPEKQETRNYIQHVLKEELGRGIINPKSKENYIQIANELIKQGAEGIILGCTEIPLLIDQSHFSVPVFDTTKIHSEAIVAFIVS